VTGALVEAVATKPGQPAKLRIEIPMAATRQLATAGDGATE